MPTANLHSHSGKSLPDRDLPPVTPETVPVFFNSIVQKEYVEKNPLKVLESVYDIIKERKAHPQDGSYTNYLFGKGTDKILQKNGEECTEIVIWSPQNLGTGTELDTIFPIFCITVWCLWWKKATTWERDRQ